MTDVEIRITDKSAVGPGIEAARKRVKNLQDDLKELKSRARDIDIDIDVDTSQVGRAEAAIRDLDSIPPPEIDVQADASDAVAGVQEQFGDIDLANMGASIGSQLMGFAAAAGPIGGAAVAAGGLLGDNILEGFQAAFGGDQGRFAAAMRTGLSDSDIRAAGADAGALYSAGWGDGLQEFRDTVIMIRGELEGVPTALDDREIARRLSAVSEVFRVEAEEITLAARRMVNQGMADTVEEATDILATGLQEAGVQGQEALDVFSEFSPFFEKAGIDGQRSMGLIASAIRDDLFPQADRAGEVIEEMVNRIVNTDDAVASLNEIEISADKVRAAFEDGMGFEALSGIVDELADMEDQTRANQLAVEIFGTSVEGVTVLELQAWLDGAASSMAGAAVSAEDLADGMQSTESEMAKAQRRATEFGLGMGNVVATELNKAADGLEIVTSGFGLFGDGADDASSAVDGLGFASADTQRAMFDMASATDDASGSVLDLTGNVADLDGALAELVSGFDRDRLFRRIDDNARRAIDAVDGLTTASYELGTGFDTSTEAGSRAEAAVEALGRDLVTLTQEYAENNITAGEFDERHGAIEAALRAVAAEMNLTEAETQDLIDRYGQVPDEVDTDVRVNIEDAQRRLAGFIRDLDNLDGKSVTTHVDNIVNFLSGVGSKSAPARRRSRGNFKRGGGVVGAAATGPVIGDQDLTLVGEEGPELVNLPPGSDVVTAGDTTRALGGGGFGGGGGGTTLVMNVTVQGSVLGEAELGGLVRDLAQSGVFDDVLRAREVF